MGKRDAEREENTSKIKLESGAPHCVVLDFLFPICYTICVSAQDELTKQTNVCINPAMQIAGLVFVGKVIYVHMSHANNS